MDYIDELVGLTTSLSEVSLSNRLTQLLGNQSVRAATNAKYIRAFTFKYISAGNLIGGFLVVPRSLSGKKMPGIIYNRGGTANFGLVKHGQLFTNIADMSRQGYVIIGSQYPGNILSEGHDVRGGEADLQSVIDLYDKIITKLSWLDDSRVGMYGESRGGMMTYMLLTRVSWIKAAVVVGAVSNMFRSIELRPHLQKVMDRSFGGGDEDKIKRSAIFWAEKFPKNVPILLLHGAQDKQVSVLDSQEIAEKLQQTNHHVALHIFNDGHGIVHHALERNRLTYEWFNRYLTKIDHESIHDHL